MAKITFLGGDEVNLGNIGYIEWPVGPAGNPNNIIFPLNKPIEVTNPHVIAKIKGQADKGWWKVEEDDKKPAPGTGAKGASTDDDEEGSEGESAHGTLKGARQRTVR